GMGEVGGGGGGVRVWGGGGAGLLWPAVLQHPCEPAAGAHSCNCRFSSSISSASAESVFTRFSIFRTACNTVVWSRPPKRRPISGSERSVSVLARYIATCPARTTFALRREDRRSARLTLYWRATTR